MTNEGPGNKSKHWNQELVNKACIEITKDGHVPTVSTVRRYLKIDKGSDSTVQRFIRLFKEDTDVVEAPPAPEPIMTAISAIWEQALGAAREEVKDQTDKLSKDKEAFKIESLAVEDSLENMESTIRRLQGEITTLKSETVKAAQVIELQTSMLDEKRTEVQERDIQLSKCDAEIEAQAKQIGFLQQEAQVRDSNYKVISEKLFNKESELTKLKLEHEAQMTQLSSELNATKEQAANSKTMTNEQAEEINKQSDEINKQAEEINELRQQLDGFTLKEEALMAELQSSKEQLKATQESLSQMQSVMASMATIKGETVTQAIVELQTQIDRLEKNKK